MKGKVYIDGGATFIIVLIYAESSSPHTDYNQQISFNRSQIYLSTEIFKVKLYVENLFGRFNRLYAVSFWPKGAKKDAATIRNALYIAENQPSI